jgi:hypothetical protein
MASQNNWKKKIGPADGFQKFMSSAKNYKSISVIAFLLLISFSSIANIADTTKKVKSDSVKYWKNTAAFGLNLNQLSLTNWATGGEGSLSGKALIDYKSRYQKENLSFELIHKSAIGVVGYGSRRIEKTEDRLDLSTSFSRKAFENWTYTTLFTFKSQFANGYKYPNDSTLISAFMAPGYITASLGFKYRKSEKFEVFLSPASGKFTMVMNQTLADKGAFGVKKAVIDSLGNIIVHGKNLLPEFGINLLASFSHDISKNIDFSSSLNLYNNYLDDNHRNRWNIDVDWETTVNFAVNKRIQTVFFLLLKYDHNINIPVYEWHDGLKKQVGEGPRLQVKESLGIGFTYKIT